MALWLARSSPREFSGFEPRGRKVFVRKKSQTLHIKKLNIFLIKKEAPFVA